MPAAINRRDWLKHNSLAALALGFALPSMANEEGITRNYFGTDTGLINLGSNENPYGISPKAKEALLSILGESNRYQFNIPRLMNFEKEIGAYYQVGSKQVLATAGSGDALGKLAWHFNRGSLVTATPTFATLPNTAKKMGTTVIEVPLMADKKHDLPAMLKAINTATQTVYICNPANPSSTALPAQALKDFCIEASKRAVVIVDEAYIDFLDNPDQQSMIGLIDQHPNILVLRTFSKIHAMAGLRVGFVVGHTSVTTPMKEGLFANSQMAISNPAMMTALASLKDEAHRETCKQKNAAARQYTIAALQQLHIQAVDSHTNFIFFPLGKYAGDFAQDMLQKNVVLRSSQYADGKWARVSIGTMEEMKAFIRLMQQDWSA